MTDEQFRARAIATLEKAKLAPGGEYESGWNDAANFAIEIIRALKVEPEDDIAKDWPLHQSDMELKPRPAPAAQGDEANRSPWSKETIDSFAPAAQGVEPLMMGLPADVEAAVMLGKTIVLHEQRLDALEKRQAETEATLRAAVLEKFSGIGKESTQIRMEIDRILNEACVRGMKALAAKIAGERGRNG